MNRTIKILIKYLIAALFVLIFLFPVFVLLNTSFKPFSEVRISEMWTLPRNFSLDGFVSSFEKLRHNLMNSFLMVSVVCFFSVLLGAVNGYVFSKWKFRGANIVFAFILFGMFIPYQSILIPLVQFLNKIKLYGTLEGLILTHVIYGLPISTLMFRNYFANLPDELLEAGMLDGLDIWAIFRKLVVPLAAPATVVVLIWQFTSVWNDFLFAVAITQKPSIQPITVALQNLAGSQVIEWNIQMAGALIAALPTLFIYIFLGKYFIQGLLAGSVKG